MSDELNQAFERISAKLDKMPGYGGYLLSAAAIVLTVGGVMLWAVFRLGPT